MEVKLKKCVIIVLSILMALSFSLVSFADDFNYEKDSQTREPRSNNRYYYEYEKGDKIRNRLNVTASQARNRDNINYILAAGLTIGTGGAGAPLAFCYLVQNHIYDMNVAGYVEFESVTTKKYKVHRLTGQRYYVSARTKVNVKVYMENGELHRSFSHTFD